MMPEELCEEIDSGPDDDDTKWVLISQPVILNAEDQKSQGPVRKQHRNDVGKHFPKASNYLCQVPTQFCYILHLYHMISIHLFNISPFWCFSDGFL
jgi:hypothetical protein